MGILKVLPGKKVFFTSDYHLFHENILKFDGRPFDTVEEMHSEMISRHNSLVSPDDIVFNLGDCCHGFRGSDSELSNIITQFNGKIYYVPGNHEDHLRIIQKHWTVLPQIQDINIVDYNQIVNLCHFPIRVWDRAHWKSWHFFGHLHGGCKDDNGKRLNHDKKLLCKDVGIMTNDYYPILFDDIVDEFKDYSQDITPHLSLGRYGH